jgi:hypothetical protein
LAVPAQAKKKPTTVFQPWVIVEISHQRRQAATALLTTTAASNTCRTCKNMAGKVSVPSDLVNFEHFMREFQTISP